MIILKTIIFFCFDKLLSVRRKVLSLGIKVLKDGSLFSDKILNFSIMVHMFSKLSLLLSNNNSAVDISAADISVADISMTDLSVFW